MALCALTPTEFLRIEQVERIIAGPMDNGSWPLTIVLRRGERLHVQFSSERERRWKITSLLNEARETELRTGTQVEISNTESSFGDP